MATRDVQRRDPLNSINDELRRFLLRRPIECIDQLIQTADRAAIDLFDRVAINDWYRLIPCARFTPRFPQWTLLANAVNLYAASNRELAERENDVHHSGGDQNDCKRAQNLLRRNVFGEQIDDRKQRRGAQFP